MIVERSQIRYILNGELDEIRLEVDKPPAIGTVQSVQSGVGKKAKCSVLVLDAWPHNDGGHVVRFQLAVKQEPIRYLSRHGYTEDPAMALRDPESRKAEWVAQDAVSYELWSEASRRHTEAWRDAQKAAWRVERRGGRRAA